MRLQGDTYTAERRIAAGAQGEVWSAMGKDGVRVGVKVLLVQPGTDSESARARFRREITCQSKLEHIGIVPVLGLGVEQERGIPYYIMPWADGSLQDLLDRMGGNLQPDDALNLLHQLVEAISFAHSEGIIHRDLKPQNVLIYDGTPKISDFGLGLRITADTATLTVTNAVLGTIQYMAPEQFGGAHDVTPAADVYALGKIFYQMLTGQVPYPTLRFELVPDKFKHIVRKATQEDPRRRFADGSEMAAALTILINGSESLQAPISRARAIIGEYQQGQRAKLHDLDDLLQDNTDDHELYTKLVVRLPRDLLEDYGKVSRTGLIQLVRNFDQYAAGGHPWSYTDLIADFYENVWAVLDDHDTQELILRRLVVLGYDHNRFHVGDVAVDLIVSIWEHPAWVQWVAEWIDETRVEFRFIKEALLTKSPPALIARSLRNI